jgi:hypothetical protein
MRSPLLRRLAPFEVKTVKASHPPTRERGEVRQMKVEAMKAAVIPLMVSKIN